VSISTKEIASISSVEKESSQACQDEEWMRYAYQLAERAEAIGEVPVGAVIVLNGDVIGEGWNQSIQNNDPTAHAEILAIKAAGEAVGNYRLLNAELYVTLEPCPMCAGAMVHARVARVVYGASDFKTGAAGSVFNLVDDERLNHRLRIEGGILMDACSTQISAFFKKRRKAHKQKKKKPRIIDDLEP